MGRLLIPTLITSALIVAGGGLIAVLIDSPLAYVVAALVGMAIGLVGSAVFKPDHETNLLCHQDHGPDVGCPPLHVPGYQPSDREKFEARIVMLREVYPDFNERAFRCMGPSRYYAAVAREELRCRAEAETPDR